MEVEGPSPFRLEPYVPDGGAIHAAVVLSTGSGGASYSVRPLIQVAAGVVLSAQKGTDCYLLRVKRRRPAVAGLLLRSS